MSQKGKKRQALPLRRLQFLNYRPQRAKPPGGKGSKLFPLEGTCNQACRRNSQGEEKRKTGKILTYEGTFARVAKR
jgi:hypothetical protein